MSPEDQPRGETLYPRDGVMTVIIRTIVRIVKAASLHIVP